MYNTINFQLINTKCPKGMNKQNCMARQCIEENSELFHVSINEDVVTLAKPYYENRDAYANALADIVFMCDLCKRQEER